MFYILDHASYDEVSTLYTAETDKCHKRSRLEPDSAKIFIGFKNNVIKANHGKCWVALSIIDINGDIKLRNCEIRHFK